MAYDESSFEKVVFPESIRRRKSMYIGIPGNGGTPEDGLYVLLKEACDNVIDEFQMGAGKRMVIHRTEAPEGEWIEVEDWGRGIPLGVLKECAVDIHGGAKLSDNGAFKKSVGMNGVGIKAVNALSKRFELESTREGKSRKVEFASGILIKDTSGKGTKEKESGTRIRFLAERGPEFFGDYHYEEEFVEAMAFQHACLNPGLEVIWRQTNLQGETKEKRFLSENGLSDYVGRKMKESGAAEALRYPPIVLKGEDIEAVICHGDQYREEIHSFVNGQNTREGGTHANLLREGIVAGYRAFTGKNTEAQDIKTSLIGAISIRISEPLFENQTKTKLGSTHTEPHGKGIPLKTFVADFIRKEVEKHLHKNPETAKALEAKILENERERRELSGIKEKSRELQKRASLTNRKLRDCRVHFNTKAPDRALSTLFITEGDSASGTFTKVRDIKTQAVFSLKGKPANCYGKSRRAIYENEELHLLQGALGIEEGIEGLRYNKVVIATDADIDGMHIRMLISTFLLQYFPDLIREGHVHVMETPLFRIRNKKETRYCYSEEERVAAIKALGPNPEITRFKGLGEISPEDFEGFIGKDMRLEPLLMDKETPMEATLTFCMGPNSPERQKFLCENLDKDA